MTAACRPPAMNGPGAGPALPGMCTDSQDGRETRADDMRNARGRIRCWRPRRRRNRRGARHAPATGTGLTHASAVSTAPGRDASRTGTSRTGTGRTGAPAAPVPAAPGDTVAAAMQLAIGLLTAGLDSPELEARAAEALMPVDVDGLGNFMAGMHVVSELLLRELQEATGEPSAATLQRLAILAEHPAPGRRPPAERGARLGRPAPSAGHPPRGE